jgi:hypothetical protein
LNPHTSRPEWPVLDKNARVPGGIQVTIQLSSGEERSDFPPYANLYTALFGGSGAAAMFRRSAAVKEFLGGSRCRLFMARLPSDDQLLVVDGETVALLSLRAVRHNLFGLRTAETVRKAMNDPDVPKRTLESMRDG